MPRLTVFVFCIAFLFAAGGFVRTGMVLAAAGALLLLVFLVWSVLRLFLGSR